MPIDYYIGKSIDDLQTMLEAVQKRMAQGNIVEVRGAGVMTRKEFKDDLRPDFEIMRIRYSLFLRAQAAGDANLLALYPNPYLERTRSTRTRYTFS